MTAYISVCGLSAVGKKTLIRRLLQDNDDTRQRFSVLTPVRAFGRSFDSLDNIHDLHEGSVIHQWQWANDSLIETLMERHPKSTHRVIVLWRPFKLQYQDILNVYGNSWQGTLDQLRQNWTDRIIPRFRDHIPNRYGIEVELVESSTAQYPSLTNWLR